MERDFVKRCTGRFLMREGLGRVDKSQPITSTRSWLVQGAKCEGKNMYAVKVDGGGGGAGERMACKLEKMSRYPKRFS